jgi:hypothetical protein
MPGLDPHSIGLLAPRARQTVGVQQLDQEPVARAWVHQVHDREIHLPASKTTATEHRRTLTLDRRMGKEQFHPDGLMSQNRVPVDWRKCEKPGQCCSTLS